MAQSEAAIRHALIAMASYHECFVQRGPTGETESSFGLSQYNLAIKALLSKDGGGPPMHVQLITNLVFLCIELIRARHASAMTLYKCGIRTARLWRQENIRKGKMRANAMPVHRTVQMIETVLALLAVQINQIFGSQDPDLLLHPRLAPSLKFIAIPPSLHSLSEARMTFIKIMLSITKMGMQPTEKERKVRYETLLNWSACFEELVNSQNLPSNDSELRAIALLRFHRGYYDLVLRQPIALVLQDPLLFDQYTTEFREILGYGAVALGLMDHDLEATKYDRPAQDRWRFHIDIGVTPTLFAIAFLCRDTAVRKTAAELLRHANLQEGMWNSHSALQIAEQLSAKEQSECAVGRNLSDAARISRIQASVDPNDQIVVHFQQEKGCREQAFDLKETRGPK